MRVKEFQELMYLIYFRKDSKRGKEGTLRRLLEEMEELEDSLKSGDQREMESEFADVLAWLSSLANLVDVDLEKAVSEKYPGTCPKCSQSPCTCVL